MSIAADFIDQVEADELIEQIEYHFHQVELYLERQFYSQGTQRNRYHALVQHHANKEAECRRRLAQLS